MKRPFGELKARVFCHATESPEKVRAALVNVIGEVEVHEASAEGYHGNPIVVMSAVSDDQRGAEKLLQRLPDQVLSHLRSSLLSKLDEACSIRLRFDKQAAFAGEMVLSSGEDVVVVRIRVNAYPAREDVAFRVASAALDRMIGQSDD